ncbi:MAG TPA: WD40 repeat domain-containing protein, partial [Pyrinomonadaceae bacterium]|nr:WD40 repeat domain-containing protein [Pyrinomonadaceae bacterium]
SNDGRKLVTFSDSIRVWDTSTWREISTIQTSTPGYGGFTGGSGGVALSPDGTQLVRIENDEIKFIDPMTAKELRSVSLPDAGTHNVELAFTSDGRLLEAGAEDKKLRVWDVTSKSDRIKTTIKNDFAIINFSNDGRLVAVADNYVVHVWDTSSGKEVSSITIRVCYLTCSRVNGPKSLWIFRRRIGASRL